MGFPHRIVTLDLMANDLVIPTPSEINKSGIMSVETSIEIMTLIPEFEEKYKVSFYDAALLLYAKKEKAILLSGDKALRKAAKREKVAVKGTLWVLEELVKNKNIEVDQAVLILERMFLLGRRLPPDESNSQIIQWEKS
jgi:predicted nucleic acid-binding protein